MPTPSRKPFVFVLMPFSKEFDDIYKLGIKPACENAGAIVERVDEQIFREKIIEQIYAQIEKADLLVADLSARNANVFYEVGYAHALNKNVVLLTQEAKDIPFDLMAYPHVVYGQSISNLKTELQRRVCHFLKNRKESKKERKIEPSVLIYNEGELVAEKKEIMLDFRDMRGGRPEITLDFHVPDVTAFGEVKQKFGIVTSSFITEVADFSDGAESVTLPDGRLLYQSNRMKIRLLPGEWFKYDFVINFQSHVVNRIEEFAVRIFTGYGPVDVPFKVHMLGNTPSEKIPLF